MSGLEIFGVVAGALGVVDIAVRVRDHLSSILSDSKIDVAHTILGNEDQPVSSSQPSSNNSPGSTPVTNPSIDDGRKDNGITSLMEAAQDGEVATVKKLLEDGADPDERDQDGWNALHHAVQRSGGRDVINALLAAGLDVNIPCNSSGEAPLHIAVKQYDLDPVKRENLNTLLENADNLECRDHAGNTPLGAAIEIENEEVITLLLENGAKYDDDPPTHVHKDIQNIIKVWIIRRMVSGADESMRLWVQV